jgi:hypothetical protein
MKATIEGLVEQITNKINHAYEPFAAVIVENTLESSVLPQKQIAIHQLDYVDAYIIVGYNTEEGQKGINIRVVSSRDDPRVPGNIEALMNAAHNDVYTYLSSEGSVIQHDQEATSLIPEEYVVDIALEDEDPSPNPRSPAPIVNSIILEIKEIYGLTRFKMHAHNSEGYAFEVTNAPDKLGESTRVTIMSGNVEVSKYDLWAEGDSVMIRVVPGANIQNIPPYKHSALLFKSMEVDTYLNSVATPVIKKKSDIALRSEQDVSPTIYTIELK